MTFRGPLSLVSCTQLPSPPPCGQMCSLQSWPTLVHRTKQSSQVLHQRSARCNSEWLDAGQALAKHTKANQSRLVQTGGLTRSLNAARRDGRVVRRILYHHVVVAAAAARTYKLKEYGVRLRLMCIVVMIMTGSFMRPFLIRYISHRVNWSQYARHNRKLLLGILPLNSAWRSKPLYIQV